MSIEIIQSSDGSHTLYNSELKETYHSTHGALQESQHVYIEKGLKLFPVNAAVNILEVGFGTGLNCLLTLAARESRNIFYETLEPYPLSKELVRQLNYVDIPLLKTYQEQFVQMHEDPFGEIISLNTDFQFRKLNSQIQDITTTDWADLVYFDAFAPSKQPEMWEISVFRKLYNAMKKGGVLVTYCASGQFKRNIKEAGFDIEMLPGPPGKKEMTRAFKK